MANGIAPSKQNYVDEFILADWMQAAEDEQHLEIIRLAGLGLACERHGVAIEDALNMVLSRLPISQISRFEKARDAIRGAK